MNVARVVRVDQRVVRVHRDEPTATVLRDTPRTVRVVATATGVAGPAGPPGEAGQGFTFNQPSALDEWLVNHNLGVRPNVQVFSTGGLLIGAQVTHLNDNQVLIAFNSPQAGFARMT